MSEEAWNDAMVGWEICSPIRDATPPPHPYSPEPSEPPVQPSQPTALNAIGK